MEPVKHFLMQQCHLEKTISTVDKPCVLVCAVPTWLSWELCFSESLSLYCPVLLLLLSRFSRIRLCDPIDGSPPDSPVSLGFSRQEH